MYADARHLQMFADLQAEVERVISDHNTACNGITDKKELIELRLAQYEALLALCAEHRRVLRFHNGEAVEPKVHFAEVVVVGNGGLSND